jgi:hypothetical protein
MSSSTNYFNPIYWQANAQQNTNAMAATSSTGYRPSHLSAAHYFQQPAFASQPQVPKITAASRQIFGKSIFAKGRNQRAMLISGVSRAFSPQASSNPTPNISLQPPGTSPVAAVLPKFNPAFKWSKDNARSRQQSPSSLAIDLTPKHNVQLIENNLLIITASRDAVGVF